MPYRSAVPIVAPANPPVAAVPENAPSKTSWNACGNWSACNTSASTPPPRYTTAMNGTSTAATSPIRAIPPTITTAVIATSARPVTTGEIPKFAFSAAATELA